MLETRYEFTVPMREWKIVNQSLEMVGAWNAKKTLGHRRRNLRVRWIQAAWKMRDPNDIDSAYATVEIWIEWMGHKQTYDTKLHNPAAMKAKKTADFRPLLRKLAPYRVPVTQDR